MSSTIKPAQKRPPICGILSLPLPFVGELLARLIVAAKPSGDAGWPYVLFGPLVFPAAAIAGLVLSVIALARHENYRALSWFGLFLNIGALVFLGIRIISL